MATNNFYKKNASYFYVIDNEEGNFDIWEFIEDDILNDLAKLGYEDIRNENKWDERDSKIIAEKRFYEDDIEVKLYVIIRAGYYSGANLDWDFEIIDNEGNEIKCGDYYENDFYDYIEDRKEKNEMKKQQKRIVKKLHKEIDKLEKMFAKITTPYIKIGQFSNGEAIYQKTK
jgi:hypothetical protein